jgi:HAE1 family hydrophobic/amphiphilic exporter-1
MTVIDELTSGIEGLEITFAVEETSLKSILGTDEAPIVVEVKGEELDEIESVVSQVREKMSGIQGLFNIQTSFEDGAPEVEIKVDRVKAGIYGISISTVITQIQNQLQGTTAGQLEKDGEMRDITIKIPERGLNEISDLTITSGTSVYRLSEIADLSYSSAPREILRRNQTRIGKVTAQLDKDFPLDKISQSIRTATSGIELRPNYNISVSGQEEKRQESMKNLGFAMLLSIILVYMVLASQFESLVHPFTIMLTIPMAFVGTILIFLITGQPINMMAVIGIIMLAGIAVNNAIILIDRINQMMREGYDRSSAIVYAAQQRIRPILMTTLTTILALLPMTISFGESASLRSPMALAVIGGLFTSTLLTLIIIPCVFDVFDRFRLLFVRKQNDDTANN